MRVQQAVEQFLEDLGTEGRSPHTVAAYRRDLAKFCEFADDTVIDAVTPAMLTSFMATESVQVRPCGTQKANATINRYRVSLKALFAWGSDRWLVSRNPTAILKCKRHRSPPPAILTDAEVDRLLGSSLEGRNATRDRALLSFMLTTGCRLGETLALNARDIDWDTGRVTLHSAKGGEPETVNVGRQVLHMLQSIARDTEPGHALFRSTSGRRLSHRQAQRIVAARSREAGIEKPVTPHILRHSFATRLYNATGDLRLVQVALRHNHITTTEQYAQLDPRRLESALGVA